MTRRPLLSVTLRDRVAPDERRALPSITFRDRVAPEERSAQQVGVITRWASKRVTLAANVDMSKLARVMELQERPADNILFRCARAVGRLGVRRNRL